MTREELRDIFIRRLTPRLRDAATWADIAAAVAGAPAEKKAEIIAHVRDAQPLPLGEKIVALVAQRMAAQAATEVDALLVGDTIRVADLERVL